VILALTGVQIAFATWSIVGKVTVEVVPPFALIALRLAGGAAFFAVLARAMRIPLVPPREVRREVALLAITGLVFNQIFFTVGLRYTGAIESSVIGSTIPIFTVAYAVLSKREQGHVWLWRGLALAMVGALVVSRPQRLTLRDDHLFGNLLILVNSASYSVYLVRGRGVMAKYGAHTVITWMFWMAALMVAPLGVSSIVATATHWPLRAWLAIGYVVAMPTAFAYGANAFALARAPSSVVAVFVYLQPVLTVVLAITCGDPLAVWLGVPAPHEHMTVQLALGMTCVLLGVFLAARNTAPRR
jgi:drug/metabolite transporter (DMT)-like permease